MIKHLFLDLGMVTVRLDMQKCIDAFAKLGINDVANQISNCRQSGIFDAIELGNATTQQFHDNVRKMYNLQITDQQIDDAWNAFILDTPGRLQDMICEARKMVKTYILSNTNQIHYDFWAQKCMDKHSVDECFDKIFLSNELHLAKPNPEIYKRVLEQSGAKPEEVLYLDDNQKNVEEALRQGWNAEVTANPEQTIERIEKLIKEGK